MIDPAAAGGVLGEARLPLIGAELVPGWSAFLCCGENRENRSARLQYIDVRHATILLCLRRRRVDQLCMMAR